MSSQTQILGSAPQAPCAASIGAAASAAVAAAPAVGLPPTAPPAVGLIEQAIVELSAISESLCRSHDELARRAERVELELERKVAELAGLNRHLSAILEALPTGVAVRDEQGRVVRVNRAALEILGVPEGELLGRGDAPALLAPGESSGEREHRRPDGERRVLALRRSDIPSADAEGIAAPPEGSRAREAGAGGGRSVEIIDDRTELVRLSERLHALDKMSALGTMAAGIAHELRNPLSAVRGFAALLARELPPTGKAARWASLILQGTAEADGIITSLLSFSAPERAALESIAAGDLLESAIAGVAGADEPGSRPAHVIERDCGAPPFRADRIKLRQALRNLVENAVLAQPHGGRVRVSLQRVGDQIEARVNDAGPGIPADLRGRVLEPFFTTRAEGTGLGLPLAHTIARLHGGSLEISSEPGELGGADVRLRIPFLPAA